MTTTADKIRIKFKFSRLFPNITDFRSYSFEEEIRSKHIEEYRMLHGYVEVNFRDVDWRKSASWKDLESLLDSIERINALLEGAKRTESVDLENADKVLTTVIYVDSLHPHKNHTCIWDDLRRCSYQLEMALNMHVLSIGDELHAYGLGCSLANRPANWESYYPTPEPEIEVVEADCVVINFLKYKGYGESSYMVASAGEYEARELKAIQRGDYTREAIYHTQCHALACSLESKPANTIVKPEIAAIKEGDIVAVNFIYSNPGLGNGLKIYPLRCFGETALEQIKKLDYDITKFAYRVSYGLASSLLTV